MIERELRENLDLTGDLNGEVTKAEWVNFCQDLDASLDTDLK